MKSMIISLWYENNVNLKHQMLN